MCDFFWRQAWRGSSGRGGQGGLERRPRGGNGAAARRRGGEERTGTLATVLGMWTEMACKDEYDKEQVEEMGMAGDG